MRKCPTCSYLLFGDGDTCKHCGAALSLASAVAAPPAVTTAAPRVAPVPPATEPGPRIWTPPPVMAPPPSPLGAPPSPNTMTPPVWRPSPAPVLVRQPQQRSLTARVLAVCLSLAMIAVGRFAYDAIAGGQSLPAGTSAFVHGSGVLYNAPDGAYSVRFPKTPTEDSQEYTVAGMTLTVSSASTESDSYEMGVIEGALPVAIPADQIDSSMKDVTDQAVSGTNGTVVSQTRGTRGVAQTLETTFKDSGGYGAHVLVEMTGSHMYVLYAHAKVGTEPLYKALNQSFEVRAS